MRTKVKSKKVTGDVNQIRKSACEEQYIQLTPASSDQVLEKDKRGSCQATPQAISEPISSKDQACPYAGRLDAQPRKRRLVDGRAKNVAE